MGIIKGRKDDVAAELFHGLNQLQHRGQDAAGLMSFDAETGDIHLVKSKGLVQNAFASEDIDVLKGPWGIGHVRYATSGGDSLEEAQPFLLESDEITLGLVYNGNIVNYVSLREELEGDFPFESSCDVEVLLNLLAKHYKPGDDLFDSLAKAVKALYEKVSGAYSVVGIIQGKGMFAFRDPRGIRPLLMARGQGSYAFASETYPMSFLGYDDLEDVPPGELIFINEDLHVRRQQLVTVPRRHCAFEYVYFAKGNAHLEGQEVYRVRKELGKALARKVRDLDIPIDIVMGVPSTSQPAAMAVAWELGVKLEEGFLRKDHAGRSFILPTQGMRQRVVSQKLAPVQSVFKDKRILIVDDSIVRGTTSKTIVSIARQCGAKSVAFASTFPRIQHPCYLGIDMAEPEEFVARWRSYDEIAHQIGADHVIYNDIEDLQEAIGTDELCLACINGKYPTDIQEVARLKQFRELCRQGEEQRTVSRVG